MIRDPSCASEHFRAKHKQRKSLSLTLVSTGKMETWKGYTSQLRESLGGTGIGGNAAVNDRRSADIREDAS